jgi:hypothetical protein
MVSPPQSTLSIWEQLVARMSHQVKLGRSSSEYLEGIGSHDTGYTIKRLNQRAIPSARG